MNLPSVLASNQAHVSHWQYLNYNESSTRKDPAIRVARLPPLSSSPPQPLHAQLSLVWIAVLTGLIYHVHARRSGTIVFNWHLVGTGMVKFVTNSYDTSFWKKYFYIYLRIKRFNFYVLSVSLLGSCSISFKKKIDVMVHDMNECLCTSKSMFRDSKYEKTNFLDFW